MLNTSWTVPNKPEIPFGSNAPGWWFGVQTAEGDGALIQPILVSAGGKAKKKKEKGRKRSLLRVCTKSLEHSFRYGCCNAPPLFCIQVIPKSLSVALIMHSSSSFPPRSPTSLTSIFPSRGCQRTAARLTATRVPNTLSSTASLIGPTARGAHPLKCTLCSLDHSLHPRSSSTVLKPTRTFYDGRNHTVTPFHWHFKFNTPNCDEGSNCRCCVKAHTHMYLSCYRACHQRLFGSAASYLPVCIC